MVLTLQDKALLSAFDQLSFHSKSKRPFKTFFDFSAAQELDREFWRRRVVEYARANLLAPGESRIAIKISFIFFKKLARKCIPNEMEWGKFHRLALVNLFAVYFEAAKTCKEEVDLMLFFEEILQLTATETQEALANLLKKKYRFEMERAINWFTDPAVPQKFLPSLVRMISREQSLYNFLQDWQKVSKPLKLKDAMYALTSESSQLWFRQLVQIDIKSKFPLDGLKVEGIEELLIMEIDSIDYFKFTMVESEGAISSYAFYLYCYFSSLNCSDVIEKLEIYFSDSLLENRALSKGFDYVAKDISFSNLLRLLTVCALKAPIDKLILIFNNLDVDAYSYEEKQQLFQVLCDHWNRDFHPITTALKFLQLFEGDKPLFKGWNSSYQFALWLNRMICSREADLVSSNLERIVPLISKGTASCQQIDCLKKAKDHVMLLIAQLEERSTTDLTHGSNMQMALLKRHFVRSCKAQILKLFDEEISRLTLKLNSSIRFEQ